MRCRRCNYPLWNLRERVCPECGQAFRPSEFDLIPSAVQFCCRGCMQPYYGTTWRGHLIPPEFDCVSCGERVVMDECILLPTQGVDEARTQQGRNPLLDRGRGPLARFFGGIGYAMVRPTEMARATPMDTPFAGAFLFALAANCLFYGACFSLMLLIGAINGLPGLMGVAGFVAYFVGAATIGALVWGAITHAVVRVTGPRAGTIKHTMLAIHYGAGANTLSGLICSGWMIGWIWWTVSACLMLKEFQRIGGLRAALAGMFPPLVCAPAALFGWMYLSSFVTTTFTPTGTPGTGTTAGAIGGATPPASVIQGAAATEVAEGLRNAMVSRAGAGQGLGGHPAALIAYRFATPDQFITTNSATTDQTMRIGGESMRDLDLAQPGQRLERFQNAIARDRAAEAAPEPWLRLGDVVAPDLAGVGVARAREAGLWVLAICPDPEANPARAGQAPVVVVGIDTPAQHLADGAFLEALDAQNRARRALGLADLNDPRQVRQGNPP